MIIGKIQSFVDMLVFCLCVFFCFLCIPLLGLIAIIYEDVSIGIILLIGGIIVAIICLED